MKKISLLTLLLASISCLSGCGAEEECDCDEICGSSSSLVTSSIDDTSATTLPVTSEIPSYSEPTETGTSSSSSDAEGDEEQKLIIPDYLTIHYHMDTPSYDSKRFYIWITGKNGVETVADGVDDFGMHLTVQPSDTSTWKKHSIFYFIVKNQGTWAGQSTDTEISYEKFVPTLQDDGKYYLDVWCIDGEAGAVEVYATKEETEGDKLSYAKFSDWRTIHVTGTGEGMSSDTGKVASYKLYALTKEYYLTDPDLQYSSLPNYIIKEGSPMSKEFDISLDQDIVPNKTYMLKVTFVNYPDKIKSKNVSMEKLYDTPKFLSSYTYSGNDLGVTYTKTKSTFKVWAPTSARVLLKIYYQGTPSSLDPEGTLDMDWYQGYEMEYGAFGVYSCSIEEDMAGYYYNYYVTNSEGSAEVVDPYARAAGINGARGQIIDLDKTNPEGWDEVFGTPWDGKEGYDIKTPQQLVAYETTIRDVTMHETWTTKNAEKDAKLRGTYLGFIEKGTTYSEQEAGKSYARVVKTGFDHIEELGVTAVQLMPIFDQDNDEREMTFNWGYNPLNYNVPEGGYSSNPYDGETAVKELKQLILALAKNKNHTRVVMDVVYNHVSSVSSNNLNRIVPKYYFRLTENGYYSDGSGCGNEVKSEAPMMRKFIVDSVSYWASEYNIKAFRFDLMKLIDVETMRQVKDAVYNIDHDAFCYGEGWALGYGGPEGTGTDSGNVYSQLYPTEQSKGILGGFNDDTRNALKGSNDGGWGSYNPYCSWGYISQGASDVGGNSFGVERMIRGQNSNGGGNPLQTISYVSCHDNYTAFDQLNYCLGPGGINPAPETEPKPTDVAKASLGIHGAVMMSQGMSFINGGEELFRSKVQDLTQVDYPVRPYPDYHTEGEIYDNTINNQETPHGAAGTLLGQEPCTDDVRMYGKVISHNSYRSNDSVNAYDYSRLINIETQGVKYSVYELANAWPKLVELKKSVAFYSYPDNFEADNVYVGNTGDSSTLVAGRITKRADQPNSKQLVFFMSGRNDTNQIDNMDAKNGKLLWNSFGESDRSYSWSGSCTLKPAKYQFLIFEA